jgi:integrase
MNRVDGIKDIDKIDILTKYLLGNNPTGRDALLFSMGIRIGLRISDLISLMWDDIYQDNGKYRDFITIRESKTGKTRKIKIPEQLKKDILTYCKRQNLRKGDYLFYPKNVRTKHITRMTAWEILRNGAIAVGINNFGTHSLRKTFGYHYYTKFHDIGALMRIFNHSSQEITLRYIGVEQDKIDTVYQEVTDIFDKGK